MRAGAPSSSIATIVGALLLASPAMAGPHDQEAVRLAVSRGEIRPLADILERVRGQLSGDVVGVEVESEKGRWVYELRVLDPKGRLFDVYVDARDGAIQRVKEK
jgi:uncharacterized membrane protein YkoI